MREMRTVEWSAGAEYFLMQRRSKVCVEALMIAARPARTLMALFVLMLALPLAAQKTQGPEPTEKLTYKEVGSTKLELWMWKPADWKATDKRSAVVFYHGGGWSGGGWVDSG